MLDSLPQVLYFVVMGIDLIGWLALMFFPRRSWANFWFAGVVIPLFLCLFYMYLLLTFWFYPPAARFTEFITLDGVYEMFGNRGLLLVGWINLITMDLVVGAWMTRKAAQIRMPYVYLLPCLIVTFVFAGFGFTLFTVLVAIGGGWHEIEKFEGQPPVNVAPVMARPSAT
jgi:ABA DEFICIENT 4-like